jgi:hypothetical protein
MLQLINTTVNKSALNSNSNEIRIVTNCCVRISPWSSLHSTSLHLRNPHFIIRIYLPLPNLTSLRFDSLHFTSLHFASLHLTSRPFTVVLWFSPHFHFASFITFLTLYLKLLGLQEKVPKASASSYLPSCMVLLTKEWFPKSVIFFLLLIFYHDRSCSDSMVFVICHLKPSKHVLPCTPWREHICELSYYPVPRFPTSNFSCDVQIYPLCFAPGVMHLSVPPCNDLIMLPCCLSSPLTMVRFRVSV